MRKSFGSIRNYAKHYLSVGLSHFIGHAEGYLWGNMAFKFLSREAILGFPLIVEKVSGLLQGEKSKINIQRNCGIPIF